MIFGWREILERLRASVPNVRLLSIGLALAAAGAVHISATMISPLLTRGDAYSRLSRSVPVNRFVLLPPARPDAQILPFQMPDVRYGICRFEATDGPVVVRATLAEPGWSISAYGPEGDSFYALAAGEGRPTEVSLTLVPPGERFAGLINDSRGGSNEFTQIALQSTEGTPRHPRARAWQGIRRGRRPRAAGRDLPPAAVRTIRLARGRLVGALATLAAGSRRRRCRRALRARAFIAYAGEDHDLGRRGIALCSGSARIRRLAEWYDGGHEVLARSPSLKFWAAIRLNHAHKPELITATLNRSLTHVLLSCHIHVVREIDLSRK